MFIQFYEVGLDFVIYKFCSLFISFWFQFIPDYDILKCEIKTILTF